MQLIFNFYLKCKCIQVTACCDGHDNNKRNINSMTVVIHFLSLAQTLSNFTLENPSLRRNSDTVSNRLKKCYFITGGAEATQ